VDTQEKKIAHEKLAEETEDIFQEPSKLGVKLSPEFLESCYTPIIQSGGKFDLKPSAFSNSDNLYYGACTQPPSAPSRPRAAPPPPRGGGAASHPW
jgi:nucleosome binding factor SPN SPT16 subunit